MEKALAGTKSSGQTDSGVTARIFGQFLTWMSEKSAPVFVVATANRVTDLPPELMRKGRFDEIFFVDLPEADVRADIFGIHIRGRSRDVEDFDLEELARKAHQFSGSEIAEVIGDALYEAFVDDRRALTTADILGVISQVTPLAQVMSDEIKATREWCTSRARPAHIVEAPTGRGSRNRFAEDVN